MMMKIGQTDPYVASFYNRTPFLHLTFSQGGATRNVPLLALCAASAGGLGAFVGTPAEVALIRMSAGVFKSLCDTTSV
jgi:hypothetical protein